MSNWGVRARVMFVTIVPMLVLAALMTAIFTSVRLSDLDDALGARGQAFARQIAAASEYNVFAGNRDALRLLALAATGEEDVLAIRILGADGETLAAVGTIADDALPAALFASMPPRTVAEGARLRVMEPIRASPIDIDDGFALDASPMPRREAVAQGTIVLELSLERIHQHRLQLLLASIGAMLAVLVGSVMLAARMSRGVSGPIREVADAVLRIGHGALHERLAVRGGGSLRRLAVGVNDMAARLEHAHDDMRRQVTDATAELRARTLEAEQANVAKSRFLAAASHDLRQPMHALGLFISELAQQSLDARSRQIVDRIAASANAMDQLLDSLLDISRLDAGVMTPVVRAFDPRPVLERIVAEQASAARSRGLQLRLRANAGWVRSDPMLFERIVGNLVSNAVRHTHDGTILVACRRRGAHLRVEVRDNGPGIAPESQEVIFQEFVQLGNPERARDKGLGLGLAIVRRLVDLLAHRLELRSAPGRGSTFAVELPLTAPEVEGRPPEDARALGSLDGLRVAIVEDDPLVRDAMAGLLSSWDCALTIADSAEALLGQQAASPQRFDVVITDLRLSGPMDGIDLVAALRTAGDGAGPQAILISGDTAPEVLARARTAGLPLLYKPVRPAKLRALLQRMLGDT